MQTGGLWLRGEAEATARTQVRDAGGWSRAADRTGRGAGWLLKCSAG